MRTTLQLTFAACLFAAVSAAAVGELPPEFKRCSRKDPNFNSCLEGAIMDALKFLKDGYPPMGVLPVDPLRITTIDIKQGHGPVSIHLTLKDLDIKGYSEAKLSNFKADIDNLVFQTDTSFKNVELIGKYTVNGKVLVLPISGEGDASAILEEPYGNLTLKAERRERNGEIYAEVTSFDFHFNAHKISMKLDNLFNGDKALGDNMNKFLNENWRDLLEEVRPAFQEAFGMVFSSISTRLFVMNANACQAAASPAENGFTITN